MDGVDDSRWNVADDRPRRANRGNMLQNLLEKGLNSDEEKFLNNLSDATSDSTFTTSEEAVDEIDSDFSDEEIEGVLEGTTIVTDAALEREERLERKKERQKSMRHGKLLGRGAAVGREQVVKLRLRPPSTIPLEDRLRAAHERAKEVRATAARRSTGGIGAMGSVTHEIEAAAKKRRGYHSRGRGLTKNGDENSVANATDEGEVIQRVRYTSSASVLKLYGVPVVISFSRCLPTMFTSGAGSN
ncbi:YL1 nuclear protein [Trypanosoma brucei equiperdum]|uniref:YL1 nuclear protein n=1 Tax=Trypanosoma brucei equiperdum TaxID=630700 RepID=A0A3L6KRV7_9TRYP|nr:YL1 nuclear protein [Trypanosoma brucei equiperdum]